MGCRSAPYMCQRIISFIRHVMQNLEYFLLNYVDDFMGLEHVNKVWHAYQALGNLLCDIGADESPEKAVPPDTVVEFLGVLFDFMNMTISVTLDRLVQLQKELNDWIHKKKFSCKQLESLLGRLQLVANCVRQGRMMVLRLCNELKAAKSMEMLLLRT